MTEYLIIAVITLAVSTLTFFSGFGLGTLLLPVFSLFFPVEMAIAATAVVHLLNNVFKAILIGRHVHKPTLLRFTIPAAIMTVLGALLLNFFSGLPAIYAYQLFGHTFQVSPVKLTIAATILGFSTFELIPRLKNWTVSPKYVPLGGALSGFFGGLSGQQGALRTAFLIRLGLDKNAFIGTTVLSAVIVDIFRLTTYGFTLLPNQAGLLVSHQKIGLIATGCVTALFGSILGKKLLKQVSMNFIQTLVGVLLILFSIALGLGWI
jgi:uncharacterized membrane protein YfcA